MSRHTIMKEIGQHSLDKNVPQEAQDIYKRGASPRLGDFVESRWSMHTLLLFYERDQPTKVATVPHATMAALLILSISRRTSESPFRLRLMSAMIAILMRLATASATIMYPKRSIGAQPLGRILLQLKQRVRS